MLQPVGLSARAGCSSTSDPSLPVAVCENLAVSAAYPVHRAGRPLACQGVEDRKCRDLPGRAPQGRPVGGPHASRTVKAAAPTQTSCHRPYLPRRPPGLGGLPEGSSQRVAGPSRPGLRWAVRAVVGLPAGSRRRPMRIRGPRDVPPLQGRSDMVLTQPVVTGLAAPLPGLPTTWHHHHIRSSLVHRRVPPATSLGSSTPSSVEGQPTRRANPRRAPKCHLDVLTDLTPPAVLQVGSTGTAPRAVARARRVVLPHLPARPRRAFPLLPPRPVDGRPDVRPSDHTHPTSEKVRRLVLPAEASGAVPSQETGATRLRRGPCLDRVPGGCPPAAHIAALGCSSAGRHCCQWASEKPGLPCLGTNVHIHHPCG